MEEIEFEGLLNYFKNNILKFILITSLVCVLGCFYITFLQIPVYTSSTTLVLVGVNSDTTTSITEDDISINSKLVDTYREIAKSRKVLEQVIKELNLGISYESLASSVEVSSVNGTEIIRISVTDEDAVEARKIANTLASVFSEEVQTIYKVQNISVLDSANLPKYASNVNVKKQVILYICVGAILAFMIIFLTFYFDTTIKGTEQVEQKINLPILGTVPNYSNKRRKKS
jgi:capsular polysaccharide biosynthesis protein